MELDMNFPRSLLLAGFAAASLLSTAAMAADHQVEMVNKGPNGKAMQFDPAFLKIAPGDTVTFVPKDKGHDSMSIDGMLPEGAETWKGKINEQITVTFTKPGLYGYKCQPHYGLGMVGLIEVGDDTSNIETLKAVKLVGAAKKRMAELFAQAEGGAAQ
jgi:pseudoazurin